MYRCDMNKWLELETWEIKDRYFICPSRVQNGILASHDQWVEYICATPEMKETDVSSGIFEGPAQGKLRGLGLVVRLCEMKEEKTVP